MNNPIITQKETFMEYFQRMDVEMLDIILDDSITYFGVNKTVFLERLSNIFKQIKGTGVAELLSIQKLTTNRYCYSLKELDLEQEFTMEEMEGRITSILSNKIVTSSEDLEELHELEIFFGLDERTDFIPTTDYVLKLHKVRNAFEEIVNDKIKILDFSYISYWIKKHKSLYKEIKKDTLMFKFNNFRNLYITLKYIKKRLKCSLAAEIAIRSFDDTSDSTIQKWKDDFNRLFFCELQSFEVGFTSIDRINKTLKINTYPNIIFKGSEFISIIKFNEIFTKYFDFSSIILDDNKIPF